MTKKTRAKGICTFASSKKQNNTIRYGIYGKKMTIYNQKSLSFS